MMLVVGSLGRGRAGQALAAAENSVPALGSPMTSLREGCSVLGRLGDGEGGGCSRVAYIDGSSVQLL
jgi:hypothetical protein